MQNVVLVMIFWLWFGRDFFDLKSFLRWSSLKIFYWIINKYISNKQWKKCITRPDIQCQTPIFCPLKIIYSNKIGMVDGDRPTIAPWMITITVLPWPYVEIQTCSTLPSGRFWWKSTLSCRP